MEGDFYSAASSTYNVVFDGVRVEEEALRCPLNFHCRTPHGMSQVAYTVVEGSKILILYFILES